MTETDRIRGIVDLIINTTPVDDDMIIVTSKDLSMFGFTEFNAFSELKNYIIENSNSFSIFNIRLSEEGFPFYKEKSILVIRGYK